MFYSKVNNNDDGGGMQDGNFSDGRYMDLFIYFFR